MYRILSILLIPLYLNADVDFEKDIASIFETHCIDCHNDKKTKGKLNLSSREKLLLHKSAVNPGDISKSVLIDAISGDEPDMPSKSAPLKKEEVDVLKKWIASGAQWPKGRILKYNPKKNFDWWSLKPIKAQKFTGSQNPVDHFVDLTLAEKNLSPNGKAAAEVLIRRLTYDLTGLPPTPKEIEDFLKAYQQNSKLTWEQKVDELLSKKEFGEKWAQHWLDVARYADTHGYDKDKLRLNAWPYRDYVIRSFNEDKAYDKFVKEQIAGDVIYPDTEDGIIGLGFLSAGPWDFVGHVEVSEKKVDGQIARHMDRDEMVAATFNVFMSSTVQCAQCHHHKFDPIHQGDYYRLHAVFAAVDRAERVYSAKDPKLELVRTKLQAALSKVTSEDKELRLGIQQKISARVPGIYKRIGELKPLNSSKLRPQYGYHSRISKSANEVKWVQVDLGKPKKVQEIKLYPAYDKFNNIGAGFGFPVRYKVEVSSDKDMKQNLRVLYQSKKDEENPGVKPLSFNVAGEPVRSIRITSLKLRERANDYIFSLGEVEVIGGESAVNLAAKKRVISKDSIEASPRWARRNLVDGIYYKDVLGSETAKELEVLQEKVRKIRQEIETPELKKRRGKVLAEKKKLEKKLAGLAKGKTVYAASTNFRIDAHFRPTKGIPRPIYLLHRGDMTSKGALMKPGAPPFWKSAPTTFTKNQEWQEGEARRSLAEYLVAEDNPLVWRTMANRLWQWTFGSPLVGTPNDFGRMGMKPTHPELLDYLALKLREDTRHSLKAIIRLLVTSEAYQRSSKNIPKNIEIDVENRFLWKHNRRRLSAEEFRDSLLFVSGRLKEDRGGPAFRDFVVKKPQHSPHYQYHLHDPNDVSSHRRTVYRFVVRSQPQPMLTTMDCADPSLSVPKRDESTTALQALAQWNNRFTEAMSVFFAEKHKSSNLEQICLEVLGREPKPYEKAILQTELENNGMATLARIIFNMSAFTYVD